MWEFYFSSGECDLQFSFSEPACHAYTQRLNVWDQKVQSLGEVKSFGATDTVFSDLD